MTRMAGERRCEVPVSIASGGGDASPVAFARIDVHTTPVSQATTRPDPELTRLRQADKGRVSPTAVGQKRELSTAASQYYLRDTQTRTYRRERAAGPVVRPATSPAKGTATETRSRRSSRIKAKSTTSAPRERDTSPQTSLLHGRSPEMLQ